MQANNRSIPVALICSLVSTFAITYDSSVKASIPVASSTSSLQNESEDIPNLATPNTCSIKVKSCFTPRNNCVGEIVTFIRSAKQSVAVLSYYLTSTKIADALVEAAHNKVMVYVIIDKKAAESRYSKDEFLASSGVNVFLDSKHQIAHNKVVIVDRLSVLTGSYNFTSAAEDSNAENFIVIEKFPFLAEEYSIDFAFHLKHAEKVVGGKK